MPQMGTTILVGQQMFARILNKARHPLRSVGKDRRGNVLVLTAAALPVMIGGAGLGVDVTQWYLWQRELQMSVDTAALAGAYSRSEEHTSELQSLMRNSYAVFCLKKKKKQQKY